MEGASAIMEQEALLLLIAGYIRKTNHPEETPEDIKKAVIDDYKTVLYGLIQTDMNQFDRVQISAALRKERQAAKNNV